MNYLKGHPAELSQGWRRGVLVTSDEIQVGCAACKEWAGAVITKDNTLVPLRGTDEGIDYHVTVGDDIMWIGNPIQSLKDIKVITYAAVAAK